MQKTGIKELSVFEGPKERQGGWNIKSEGLAVQDETETEGAPCVL